MNLFDHIFPEKSKFIAGWFKRRLKTRTVVEQAKLLKADRERQALNKIKDMCLVAKESAEKIGANPHGDEAKADRLRFDSAKRISVKLLDDITDISNRDDALVHIIELCLNANDLETGIRLIKNVQNEKIREKLLKEYPVDFY